MERKLTKSDEWDKRPVEIPPIIITKTRDKILFFFLMFGGLAWYTHVFLKLIFGQGLM